MNDRTCQRWFTNFCAVERSDIPETFDSNQLIINIRIGNNQCYTRQEKAYLKKIFKSNLGNHLYEVMLLPPSTFMKNKRIKEMNIYSKK